MTPHLNDATLRDRMQRPLAEAKRLRAVRIAKERRTRSVGLHSLRESVGHGLIALGSRLVEADPRPDETGHRSAA